MFEFTVEQWKGLTDTLPEDAQFYVGTGKDHAMYLMVRDEISKETIGCVDWIEDEQGGCSYEVRLFADEKS